MRFLVWGVAYRCQTVNFIWGFHCCIWDIAPWLGMLQFQTIQPTRSDIAIEFQSKPVLRWIMRCVGKPSQTHGINTLLWLICYIQCGFSISYLSISDIVAHDRCNISHIFTFYFQFQCRTVSFIYMNIFWEDSKQGCVVGARGPLCGHNDLFQDCFV